MFMMYKYWTQEQYIYIDIYIYNISVYLSICLSKHKNKKGNIQVLTKRELKATMVSWN